MEVKRGRGRPRMSIAERIETAKLHKIEKKERDLSEILRNGCLIKNRLKLNFEFDKTVYDEDGKVKFEYPFIGRVKFKNMLFDQIAEELVKYECKLMELIEKLRVESATPIEIADELTKYEKEYTGEVMG